MTGSRHKTIAVTPDERLLLGKAKEQFEAASGKQADWGGFLIAAGLTALALYGVHKIAQSSRAKPVVNCPECGQVFSLALAGASPPVTKVVCPYCSKEVVVYFQK